MSNIEKINSLISQLKNKNLKIAIHNIVNYIDILQLISDILTNGSEEYYIDENNLTIDKINKIFELINIINDKTKIINSQKNFMCQTHNDAKKKAINELIKNLDKLKDYIVYYEKVLNDIPKIIINYEAKLPLTVNYTDINRRQSDYKDDIYGYNFNSKMFLEFETPHLNVLNKVFKSIEITGIFNDQQVGGTNQSHIRIYINKEIKDIIYYNREIKNSNFKIILTKLKKGDIVSAWACTPGWNGWSITINKTNVFLYFD
jgi:hypothetical protein